MKSQPIRLKAKYRGNGNIGRTVLGILSCLVLAAIASVANAAPVIYEPFADSDSALDGNTCGTGLSGNWTANIGTISTPSIVWGSLATSGNRVASVFTGRIYASTGTTLDGLLDDGDTLWFSVLIINGDVSTNPDFAFALGTDSLISNSSNMETGGGGNGLGFRHKGNNGGLNAVRWSGGTVVNGTGTLGMSAGDTHLFVGEMIFGATDTINIYMPDTDLKLGSVIATQTATLDQTQFDTISFGIRQVSSTPYQIDEIRFGATYDDVVPVPAGAPVISSVNPMNEAVSVSKSADLIATFSKPVQLTGGGTITITNLTLSTVVEVFDLATSSNVTLTDNAFLTIDPTDYLSNSTHYAVLISNDAVEDLDSQPFAGISDVDEWDFTTTSDATAPTITGKNPADGTTGDLWNDIVATFSEDIQFTGSGSVTLRNVTLASDETVYSLPHSLVTISGSTLTIAAAVRRSISTTYAVQVSADAVEDLAGNIFAGITDETTWAFSTLATTYFEWTGAVDGNWNDPGNWTANGVPYDTVPTDSRLTIDGTDERIVFDSATVPTANIPALGGWSTGDRSTHNTPPIVLSRGSLTFSLSSQNNGFVHDGPDFFMGSVGDGDIGNGTASLTYNYGNDGINRDEIGDIGFTVYTDGSLTFDASADPAEIAYDSNRAVIFTLGGSLTFVDAVDMDRNSLLRGDSYVEFTSPTATFTAKFGGDFATLTEVDAQIGASLFFRSVSVPDPKSMDNGDGTFTVFVPPAAGTIFMFE